MATFAFQMTSTPLTGTKTFTGTDADMQALLDWASEAYEPQITGATGAAVFTASIGATAMSVTAIASGTLAVGDYLYNLPTDTVATGTRITAQNSGSTGSTGTYTVNNSQTVASGSISAYTVTTVGVQLATSTMLAWKAAVQKYQYDPQVAAVAQPAPITFS